MGDDSKFQRAMVKLIAYVAIVGAIVPMTRWASAHDELSSVTLVKDDGRFASSPLKPWFDQLKSGNGLCCSFADGVTVEDVDWDVHDGHYRVHLDGQWLPVPDDAVVTEPNRYGRAVVWPYQDAGGATRIRCFMPGAGT
jgi:hypothetical protein